MHIQSIELIGFKSFYNKTKIDFKTGLNAVVGPNGCGKSNIIDALRWVLGEQNPRMLRAESMEELISNGSAALKPLGMAEVTLLVERVPGLGFEEASIKRRLYRSGESEYYINGVRCRLKDITEIFLDTGAGARGYSIIGQGKVEEFITAKPEDKRRLIEEVAGVVKYKTRRKETQSRIESTRENLKRISDMKAEVLRQMRSLSRQAKEAEQYKKLTVDLKTLEIRILAEKLENFRKEKDELLSKKSGLESKISELRDNKDQKSKMLGDTELENSKLDQSISDTEQQILGLRSSISEKRSFLDYAEKESAGIDEYIQKLEKEIVQLGEEKESIQSAREIKKQYIDNTAEEKQKIHSELDSKEDELEALRNDSLANRTQLENTKTVLFDILNKYSSVKGTAVGTGKELEEMQTRLERYQADKENISRSHDILASRLDENEQQLRGLNNSKNEKEGLKVRLISSYEEKNTKYDSLAEETSRIKEKRSEALSKIEVLKQVQANYEWLPEATRDFIINQSFEGILGVVSDFVQAPENYEKALEAALGEKLNWVVVKDSADAVSAVDALRNSKAGRGTFLPAGNDAQSYISGTSSGEYTKIKDMITVEGIDRSIIDSMLSDVIVVPSLEEAISIKSGTGRSLAIVTQEGDFIDRSGAITGGYSAGGVFERKRELVELEGISADYDQKYNENIEQIDNLKLEIENIKQEISKTDDEIRADEISLISMEKDLSSVKASLIAAESKKTETENEIAQLNSSINQKQQKVREFNETLSNLEREREEIDGQFNKFEEIVRNFERRERLIEQDITGLKVRSASMEETEKSVSAEIESLGERDIKLSNKITEEKNEIGSKENEKVELYNRCEEAKNEIEGFNQQLRFLEKNLSDIKTSKEEFQRNLSLGREQLVELDQSLTELRESSSSLEVSLNSVNIEMGHIKEEMNKLREEGDPGHEPAEAPEEEFNLEEATIKYDKLKKKVDRFGLVNLLAPEEYKKLEDRHTFLTEQTDDLESALESLLKAINKLDRESVARFKEAFEVINDKFSELISKLFTGGEGKLLLSEPDNLLETGIEVMVKPGGKRFQNINLLSGGEKALSAIAMIMSACLVKPVPFLLLDEIDAPLDESNTVRFSKLIREIAEDSQVVLITHNKTTMVDVDTLLGVTAGKSVASKVVSVELDAA